MGVIGATRAIKVLYTLLELAHLKRRQRLAVLTALPERTPILVRGAGQLLAQPQDRQHLLNAPRWVALPELVVQQPHMAGLEGAQLDADAGARGFARTEVQQDGHVEHPGADGAAGQPVAVWRAIQ